MFEYEIFNIRTQEDFNKYYPLLESWWVGKGANWTPIHPNLLSSKGVIIKYKDKYICAGWVYCTDSLYGIINWLVTNNEKNQGKIKKEALKLLLKKLEEIGVTLGIQLIYIPMETNSIKKILEKESYIRTSNNISEFFKQIR